MAKVNTRVLMIAYHFPPLAGSSGVQRTLHFSRHLLGLGWRSWILGAHPRAFGATDAGLLDTVPKQVEVHRAFALDTAKHLSLGGKYPGFMSYPDRWVTWWFGAVPMGWKLIHHIKPAILWSTYPIATAHLIGLTLHKLTGIPWVADFRDPLTEDHYPRPWTRWVVCRWIERHTLKNCAAAIFTTPGTLSMFRARYPHLPDDRFHLIPNGYDEDLFKQVELTTTTPTQPAKPLVLLHSGIIYREERDPTQFFAALSELVGEGVLNSKPFHIILRATQNDTWLTALIQHHRLQDWVTLAPSLPYKAALKEMLEVDGLLILQAANCNAQIPAKLYEYLRAGRPILGLTDPQGDTAMTLHQAGCAAQAPLDSVAAIKEAFMIFIEQIRTGTTPPPQADFVDSCSRLAGAQKLAKIFQGVLSRE